MKGLREPGTLGSPPGRPGVHVSGIRPRPGCPLRHPVLASTGPSALREQRYHFHFTLPPSFYGTYFLLFFYEPKTFY